MRCFKICGDWDSQRFADVFCYIFLMIWGTSKMFTKSGPIDPVFIIVLVQTIQEIYGSVFEIINSHISFFIIPSFQIIRHFRTSRFWEKLISCDF